VFPNFLIYNGPHNIFYGYKSISAKFDAVYSYCIHNFSFHTTLSAGIRPAKY